MTGTRTTNRPSLRLHPALRRAWSVDRTLTLLGVVTITVFAATLGGLLLDHRAIMGEPAWLKPAKFALSISVYSFTLVWLLGCVVGHRRLVRTIAQVTAVTLGAELAIIVLQVVRGATSHFNDTTPVDAALWATMGGLILGAWFANALAALLLLRQRFTNQAVAWSLRWGLLLSLVGMLVAVPMVISGGHTIGAADGGPGLPLVGWSTVAGDLRVAHFLGLHGLQILPLVGWAVARRPALCLTHQQALVHTAACTYLALILLLTGQALRGQPLVRSDAATLASAAIIAGCAIMVLARILGDARRRHRAGVDLEAMRMPVR